MDHRKMTSQKEDQAEKQKIGKGDSNDGSEIPDGAWISRLPSGWIVQNQSHNKYKRKRRQ